MSNFANKRKAGGGATTNAAATNGQPKKPRYVLERFFVYN